MTHPLGSPASSASSQLAAAVRELDGLIDRLDDAALGARGLAAATHWQAKAATAFREASAEWAGDVSGLRCAAESARSAIERARRDALLVEASSLLAPLAQGALP